jgi:SOS response regulatory protein OraA/RecX
VSRDVVELVLGERAPDAEIEQARRALSRPLARWATLPPEERKRKIHAHLAARGFGYDTIEALIRREAPTEDD